MRTDSLNLSEEALKNAGQVITKMFGKEYHKSRKYKTKSSNAQEAHEAIRPVDFSRTPESVKSFLEPQAAKLYELIWKRTLASQMEDAQVEVTTFSFSPTTHLSDEWIVKGEVIKFDGFMKLYIESNDDENDEDGDSTLLPNLSK